MNLNERQKMRSIGIQLALTLVCLTGVGAENPFLALTTPDRITEPWSGIRWSDQTETSPDKGSPIQAVATVRRVANMPWGQIVRYRFQCSEREVPPLYFLVRDDVILELVSDDMESLIGRLASMKSRPKYEAKAVRALSEPGRHDAKDGPWEIRVTSDATSAAYRTHHSSGHFGVLAWEKGSGLVEYSMGYGASKHGFHLRKRPFSFTESIGPLMLACATEEVLKSLSTAQILKGANEFWGADGAWHQSWSWPERGITIDMISEEEEEPKNIASIEVEHPCQLKTKRGIGIGDDMNTIAAAGYKINAEESNEGFTVIGALHGGLIFHHPNSKKITKMFLGATVE